MLTSDLFQYLLLFTQVEIHHASEVDEIFDAISYDKGASVIRMLQSYLGAERFQVSYWLSLKFFRIVLFLSVVSTFCSTVLLRNVWKLPQTIFFLCSRRKHWPFSLSTIHLVEKRQVDLWIFQVSNILNAWMIPRRYNWC